MSNQQNPIHIDHRLLHIGGSAYALAHIASIATGPDPKVAKARRALVLVAAILIIAGLPGLLELLPSGLRFSVRLGALVPIGIGVALLLAATRLRGESVNFTLSDGTRAAIPIKERAFRNDVYMLLTRVIEAGPDHSHTYVIDVSAGKVHRNRSQQASAPAQLQHADVAPVPRLAADPLQTALPIRSDPPRAAALPGADPFRLGQPKDDRHVPLAGSGPALASAKAADPVRHDRTQPPGDFDALLARIAPRYGSRFPDILAWLRPAKIAHDSGDAANEQARTTWMIFMRDHVPAMGDDPTIGELARLISTRLRV
ncbi:MAG: DUF6232 family protein [Hyphomicrobiaceae bacterium]